MRRPSILFWGLACVLAGLMLALMVMTWPAAAFDRSAALAEADAGILTTLHLEVNYGHDWAYVETSPWATVLITVTNSGGFRATVTGQADGDGYFYSFAWPWEPMPIDIIPQDSVFAESAGMTAAVDPVGTITGNVNVTADKIAGTISAPWFAPDNLPVTCAVWQEGGPGMTIPNVPAAGGSYVCDFSGQWDIQPGQEVGVYYREPDGDLVVNVFHAPAADMRVEKWADGNNRVAPGGLMVFQLTYTNDGDATATTVWLTDTLPANTSYVTDSSGVVPTVVGNQVVWQLGPVAMGANDTFEVVLTNMNPTGAVVTNQADIAAPNDFNATNNHAEAQVTVATGTPDLHIVKYIIPGDPVPGQSFTYELWYGNNGPVPSGTATIVDTLPPHTTIVSWYSANEYGLWQDNSTASQLVLQAPTLPGYWSDRIILRLLLDNSAQSGTPLTNVVEITAPVDADLDNNAYLHHWGQVGQPRWDGSVTQDWGWGTLTAGGEIGFNLHVWNEGNMAAVSTLVDTLPANTTFKDAWAWVGPDYVLFPPDSVDAGTLTWNLGMMQPADHVDIDLRLAIGAGVNAGTELTNCADLYTDGPESVLFNNHACVTDVAQTLGPNLRLNKAYWWESQSRLDFALLLQNVGTRPLRNVWVTDNYPAGVSWNGDWWVDYGPQITVTHHTGEQQLLFWLDELHPGEAARINYRVNVSPDLIGVPGLSFTNMADAPVADDVHLADNAASLTATTGPDLYVEKWLSAGEPRPGAIITFTVRFGNMSAWPWDSGPETVLRDTMPAELTFIKATAPWNRNNLWIPTVLPGNVLQWNWGTMWGGGMWQFDIVAQVADNAPWDAVLVNQVEVTSLDPDDIEANTDNNTAAATFVVTIHHLYLPYTAR
ncbi:MAG: DUF11 domain-containing protein [Ardenticatenales bacterium]|nr:DUF11 domain-containing protein [Ardenticatenales bacterium]